MLTIQIIIILTTQIIPTNNHPKTNQLIQLTNKHNLQLTPNNLSINLNKLNNF